MNVLYTSAPNDTFEDNRSFRMVNKDIEAIIHFMSLRCFLMNSEALFNAHVGVVSVNLVFSYP